MKAFLTGSIAALVLCGVCVAQDPASTAGPSQGQRPVQTLPAPQGQPSSAASQAEQPASAQASGGIRIAPGSVIPVQLTKSVDAKKVKAGDAVEAKVTQDLKTGTGEVIVPKDTKVVGHVTEAQARSKEQKESQLAIAFDHAVMKSGDVALPMSIQAIIVLQNSNNSASSGGGESAPMPAPGGTSAGSAPGGSGSRSGGQMGGNAPAPSSGVPQPSGNYPSQQQTASATPAITGNTQGVVGASNLKLSPLTAKQPSVVSSEKGNVKLESGTLMLLRVNQ